MSIYDRDYMRGQGEKKSALSDFFGRISAVKALIIINVAIFIIGAFVDRFFGYGTFFSMFDLSLPGLASGKIWTVVTYSFLHAGLAHIAFNMLALYFMGTPLESWIGSRKFLFVYFAGALAGAALWLLFSFGSPVGLVGASASVMAVFACFCALYPPMPVTFLLFFVLPISIKPINMLKIAAALEALGLLYTLSGGLSEIAYAGHLGGIAAGFLAARAIKSGKLAFLDKLSFKLPRRKSEKYTKSASEYSYRVNISNPKDLKNEVDRILDKISEKGFASLTESERQTLVDARRRMK